MIWPHKNPAEVLLWHDNAGLHTCLKTQKAITQFGYSVLPHPPYGPDVAPSDFHLFGALKDVVRGGKFQTNNDVTRAMRTWLREQDKAWYQQGKHTPIPHWHKATEVDKDFVEKYDMESNRHTSSCITSMIYK
jgi:histone-lysine N-methyltransferase SETMAR